jgi:iron complex transport system substrate-binding protein
MRVLSLLPSTTEVIYALGAEDQLVGVTHECDWPPAAREKPHVTGARITPDFESSEIDRLVREQLDDSGSLYTLDMDLVRELRPELVLTQQLCTVCAVGYETVQSAMASLDDPPEVMNVEPRNLAQVFDSFVAVADKLGLLERGEDLVGRLHESLDRLRSGERGVQGGGLIPLEIYRQGDRGIRRGDRILFLEWLIPPFSAGHWIPELVEAAGLEPVLANRGEHSRGLSWGDIGFADFDGIIISCCGFSIDRTRQDLHVSKELESLLSVRPDLTCLIADGNHYFSRPGPRLVDSAEALAAACIE